MFELAAGEIGYSRSFLPEIFAGTGRRLFRGGQKEAEALGSVLLRVGERMLDEKGQPVETIWEEEMGAFLKTLFLTEQEKQEVLSFPDAVCYLDGERQKRAVERFAADFSERAKDARQKAGQEKKNGDGGKHGVRDDGGAASGLGNRFTKRCPDRQRGLSGGGRIKRKGTGKADGSRADL